MQAAAHLPKGLRAPTEKNPTWVVLAEEEYRALFGQTGLSVVLVEAAHEGLDTERVPSGVGLQSKIAVLGSHSR